MSLRAHVEAAPVTGVAAQEQQSVRVSFSFGELGTRIGDLDTRPVATAGAIDRESTDEDIQKVVQRVGSLQQVAEAAYTAMLEQGTLNVNDVITQAEQMFPSLGQLVVLLPTSMHYAVPPKPGQKGPVDVDFEKNPTYCLEVLQEVTDPGLARLLRATVAHAFLGNVKAVELLATFSMLSMEVRPVGSLGGRDVTGTLPLALLLLNDATDRGAALRRILRAREKGDKLAHALLGLPWDRESFWQDLDRRQMLVKYGKDVVVRPEGDFLYYVDRPSSQSVVDLLARYGDSAAELARAYMMSSNPVEL